MHKTRCGIVSVSNVIFRSGHLSAVPLNLHSHLPLVSIFLVHRNKHCYTTNARARACVRGYVLVCVCACLCCRRIHESSLRQIRKRVWNRGIRYVKLFRGMCKPRLDWGEGKFPTRSKSCEISTVIVQFSYASRCWYFPSIFHPAAPSRLPYSVTHPPSPRSVLYICLINASNPTWACSLM